MVHYGFVFLKMYKKCFVCLQNRDVNLSFLMKCLKTSADLPNHMFRFTVPELQIRTCEFFTYRWPLPPHHLAQILPPLDGKAHWDILLQTLGNLRSPPNMEVTALRWSPQHLDSQNDWKHLVLYMPWEIKRVLSLFKRHVCCFLQIVREYNE